jgi:hypothetical protein
MKNNTDGVALCPRRYFYIIFFLSVGFRLILWLLFDWKDHIFDDYDTIAVNILKGNGFSFNGSDPTVCRAPAYPLYLAIVFKLFGYQPEPFWILRLLASIVDSFTAVLVFWLSSRWLSKLNKFTWLSAGLLYALNPFLAVYALKLGSETIYIFFYAVYLVYISKLFHSQPGSWTGSLLLGITGGILILNKSIFLPIVVTSPLILFALFRELRTRRHLLKVLFAITISGLILFPWAVRNTRVTNRVVLVQTLAGYNFWYDFVLDDIRNEAIKQGNLDGKILGEGAVLLEDGQTYHPAALTAEQDAEYDHGLLNKGIGWILQNPQLFSMKIADNLLSFWYVVSTFKSMIFTAIFALIFLLFSFSGAVILFSGEHRREALFLLLLAVLFDLIYSPVISMFRFSLVAYPLLSILAGTTLYYCVSWIISKLPSPGTSSRISRRLYIDN